jgi:hypothetical protein
MDQIAIVNGLSIKWYRNLLDTSINAAERRIIQKLLTEEQAKQTCGWPNAGSVAGRLKALQPSRATLWPPIEPLPN